MGNVSLQKFYPDNGTVSATEVNANYTAVAGSSQGVNQENVGSEGIIRDHFDFGTQRMTQKYAGYQENGYYLAEGATPAAHASRYESLTDTSRATANKTTDANKEFEINHNSSGVSSTSAGAGTKIDVGGGGTTPNGITLEVGDVLHVFWTVNMWQFTTQNSTLANYVCELIDSTSVRSTTLNYGICIYPQFNCVDNTAADADFHKPDDGSYGFSDDSFRNPPDGVFAQGGGGGVSDPASTGLNNLSPFADKRHDHWTWVPVLMGTGGNAGSKQSIATCFDAVNGPDDAKLGSSKLVSGQTFIKIDTQRTLYAIQLYCSGLYSTHYDTGTNKNCAFIEDQAVTNASGGIDGDWSIERASIGYVIYRKEGC